jgi:hypothetical protein
MSTTDKLADALRLAIESHGVLLMSDPPHDARKARQVELKAREALAAYEAEAKPAEPTITVQEAWEAAGGNPGIKATKEDLLAALAMLDRVCDEAEAKPAPAPLTDAELDAMWREAVYSDAPTMTDFVRKFARAAIEASKKGGAA